MTCLNNMSPDPGFNLMAGKHKAVASIMRCVVSFCHGQKPNGKKDHNTEQHHRALMDEGGGIRSRDRYIPWRWSKNRHDLFSLVPTRTDEGLNNVTGRSSGSKGDGVPFHFGTLRHLDLYLPSYCQWFIQATPLSPMRGQRWNWLNSRTILPDYPIGAPVC